MKKAFTLLEVVISISIFMIILIFLYQVFDDTKLQNSKFEEHLDKNKDTNYIYKIVAEDIAESKNIKINKDKNNNSILTFETYNTYHNPFYINITYMVSSKNNLVRIEGKIKKNNKTQAQFLENSFIDIISKDIEKFVVLSKGNKYIFIIKPKDKDRIMFPTFTMRN